MSDDITRQRFWSWNNSKPDMRPAAPRVPKSRSRNRSLRSGVAATHVLMIRLNGTRDWRIVADRSGGQPRDVSGSEAFVLAELEKRSRHYPADEFRALPWPEAKRELRRKTWSVKDGDHVPEGSQVMLMRSPAEMHPSLAKVHVVFGMSRESETKRTGIVKHRYKTSGTYMVELDGTGVTIAVERADLIYPAPDNVVPLERPEKKSHKVG